MTSLSRLFITLFSLCAGFTAGAQELTLNMVTQEAMSNSPEVLKARSAAKEASWKKRESWSGFLPTVTGGASYLTDKRYMMINPTINGNQVAFPSIIPTANYTLTASLPLFDGFASTNTLRASYHAATAAEQQKDWAEFSVQRQTALLFYKSLAAESLKEVAYQNLSTLKDHQKDVAAMKRAGISTKYDVLRTETQISEADSEIINSEDNVVIARYKLGEVLGKDHEDRPVKGILPVLKAEMIKSLGEKDIEHRNDIRAIAERVDAAEYNDRAQGRFWVPRISFFGQYQRYNNLNSTFWDNQVLRDAYQVGFNLTWNLFDGFYSISRSMQASEQRVQLQKTLLQARLKAAQDFEFWRRKFLYFCAVYKARAADIERSTEAVRLAREGRKVGARTTTELLDAELDLFRARAGLVNAQIGSIEALIQLELASGEKLYDFN